MTNTEAVRFLLTIYPEYKGMLLFNTKDMAQVYMRGNERKMREFLIQNSVPFYLADAGSKRYNIYEVQEEVTRTRWAQKGDSND